MINALRSTLVRLAGHPARETVKYNDLWQGHKLGELALPLGVKQGRALQQALGPGDPLVLTWPLKEAWLAGLIPKRVTAADAEQMTKSLIMNRDIAAKYPGMKKEYFPDGFVLSPSFLMGIGSLKEFADYKESMRTLLDYYDTASGLFRNAAIPIPSDKATLDGKYSLTMTRGCSECDLGLELSVILSADKDLLSATRNYETRGLFPRVARLGVRSMPDSLDIVAIQGMIGNTSNQRYPSGLYESKFQDVQREMRGLFKGLDVFNWLTAAAQILAVKLGLPGVRGIKAERQLFTFDPEDVDWEHFRRMYDERFLKLGFSETSSAAWLGKKLGQDDLSTLFLPLVGTRSADNAYLSEMTGRLTEDALLTLKGTTAP